MRTTIFAIALTMSFPFTAAAQDFSGGIELSFGDFEYGNSDDSESGSLGQLGAAAYASVTRGDWMATIDVNHASRDLPAGDSFEDYFPEGATAYGLHVGRNLDDTYFGGFYGQNRFQGVDAGSTNGYVTGNLFGLEFQHNASFGNVFGQLGKADMVGDDGDTAFDGSFFRVGIEMGLAGGIAIASYEKGSSPSIFEDEDDSGTYDRIDLIYERQLSSRVYGSLGVEFTDIQANTEDSASETTYRIGVRVPIGSEPKRNNLKTTYMPGLAAAWAETLD